MVNRLIARSPAIVTGPAGTGTEIHSEHVHRNGETVIGRRFRSVVCERSLAHGRCIEGRRRVDAEDDVIDENVFGV